MTLRMSRFGYKRRFGPRLAFRKSQATIHLAGTYRLAVDRGIERGFAVPLRKEGAGQAFDIVLAHGEGTMIDLQLK